MSALPPPPTPPPAPSGPPDERAAADPEGAASPASGRWRWLTTLPGWLVSAVVHLAILLALALITLTPQTGRVGALLTVPPARPDTPLADLPAEAPAQPVVMTPEPQAAPLENQFAAPALESPPQLALRDEPTQPPPELRLDFGETLAPRDQLLEEIGSATASSYSGRTGEAKQELLNKYGGTPASESAVNHALEWLARHQWRDGGWSFDHRTPACRGQCPNPGRLAQARIAATAMALLPFLGAGHTHKEGPYQETVRRGLYFLTSRMRIMGNRGDLSEPEAGGAMYSHGLAAIVLCEAYGMTGDRELMRPAQLALNFIVWAQDPVGGGWRYRPRQPGDTSMVGWQLMALKSGAMAYLAVPRAAFAGASRFLDSVQSDYGATYGYKRPGDRLGDENDMATTAIGLLCRMYLGWEKGHPGLHAGVKLLSRIGPSKTNMYYNYYATQVMRHWGGEPWERWNSVMRDYLVASQAKKGHANGSWYFQPEGLFGDRGASHGGRLYFTSLAAMILEVYYRHMPLYGQRALEKDFPL